jgi:signal transduction histidine kinase
MITASRSRRSMPLTLVGITVFGGAATFAVANAAAMSVSEAAELSGIAAASALVATILGVSISRTLHHRSFATQIAGAACVALFACVVGVWVAARAMFVSDQELGALAVILVSATTVAAMTALFMGRRIGGSVETLLGDVRTVGDGAASLGQSRERLPIELARVRDELARSTLRLEESRQRERALDTSRRELIAWVSHDLRTPLAGIRALAEALEDRVVDDAETIARYHSALRIESDLLAGLIDDLFELSRTQAGVLRLEFERVSLRDLVSDALATAAPIAAAKGVHLEGRINDPVPELLASAPEVLRALRNILENAVRHTPADGTIIVDAGGHDDSAYVSIADSGGGIPPADLAHVFDAAFRGDHARTPGGGAGLGLAIARGLVEAHRGEISVCNDNGGARFTVTLPLV